ncbi:thymosin beta 1 [Micropterus salmoides]|nr:thymosin beta 1 [Micropterus salmoides]XP_045886920.1 thymosin beta 1 [Micropterus dolomieu]
MSDKQEVIQQVEKFDKGKLKKSNTEEKNYIPTQQEIEEEKKAMKEGKCN